jgi:RimJ/RimL family protein N-acetyltransferase
MTDEDLASFLAYRNQPEVNAFGGTRAMTSAEAQRFIDRQKERLIGVPGQWLQILIEVRETGRVIGDLGFRVDGEFPYTAEIGYRLGTADRGHGYATEAASGLLDYAFGVLRLHRVIAYVDCDNAASIALLERLHFRREGYLVQSYLNGDRWVDEYLYAMLDAEWI